MLTNIKEIAKRVREDIKAAKAAGKLSKDLKVSVRMETYSMGQSLHVTVTAVPAGFLIPNAAHVRWNAENPHRSHFDAPAEARNRTSEQALAVLKVLKDIVQAYNWDRSDRMVDHFDVNFYEHIEFDWRLESDQREAMLAQLAA